jgi:hypothetical protein
MYYNSIGTGANLSGSIDIVAHSISLIRDDGTIEPISLNSNNPQFTNLIVTGTSELKGSVTCDSSLTVTGPLRVNGSASFSGSVSGLNASMVNLAYVDDTSDLNKPIRQQHKTL